MKRIVRNVVTLSIAISTVGLAACQRTSESPKPPSSKALMKSDRDLLEMEDSAGAAEFDRDNRNLFSKIFGGTSGRDVRGFLDERLKYFFTEEDLNAFQMDSPRFTYTNWKKTDQVDQDDSKKSSEKGEVGASNVGAGLFAQGVVEGTPVAIKSATERIVFDSPRVGMMLVGPGYKASVSAKGQQITLPAAYRQAILVHEARHSDCSIRTTKEDFAVARTAISYRDFLAKFKNIECGHLHTLCPSGHDFAGIAACDRQPWGAYSIGAIFVAARMRDAKSDLDRRILEATASDAITRLLFDPKTMKEGQLGEPQMKQIEFEW
ncbi:MAG: hypothetical protein AAB250_06975 [Bdellovibrionota bacterium]